MIYSALGHVIRRTTVLKPCVDSSNFDMDEIVSRAAFKAVVDFYGRHADAKADLQNRFPSIDFALITEVYLAACELHEKAYSIADKHRDGIYTGETALRALRTECPGFPEQVYKDAFNQGWFESR